MTIIQVDFIYDSRLSQRGLGLRYNDFLPAVLGGAGILLRPGVFLEVVMTRLLLPSEVDWPTTTDGGFAVFFSIKLSLEVSLLLLVVALPLLTSLFTAVLEDDFLMAVGFEEGWCSVFVVTGCFDGAAGVGIIDCFFLRSIDFRVAVDSLFLFISCSYDMQIDENQ